MSCEIQQFTTGSSQRPTQSSREVEDLSSVPASSRPNCWMISSSIIRGIMNPIATQLELGIGILLVERRDRPGSDAAVPQRQEPMARDDGNRPDEPPLPRLDDPVDREPVRDVFFAEHVSWISAPLTGRT